MAGPALGKLITIGSSDDEPAMDSIANELTACGNIHKAADPVVGKLIDIGHSDDEFGLPQALQTTITSVDKHLGRCNDAKLPPFLDTRSLGPKFELPTADTNVPFIENEKFDFDLSSSSTNSADDDDDDEVFCGPVGHKEKCVVVSNLLDMDLIDDKHSSDALTAEQMSQVVVEASKIVAKLSQEAYQTSDEETKANKMKVDKNCNVIVYPPCNPEVDSLINLEPEVDSLINLKMPVRPPVKRRCSSSSSDTQNADTVSVGERSQNKFSASKLQKPCLKKPAMKNYSKSTLRVRFGKPGTTSTGNGIVSTVQKTEENEKIETDISNVNISQPRNISDGQLVTNCKAGPSELVLKPVLSVSGSAKLQQKPGTVNRMKKSAVVTKSGPLKALPLHRYHSSASDSDQKSTESNVLNNIPNLEETSQLPAPSSVQKRLQRPSLGTPVQLRLPNSTYKGSGPSSLVINKHRLSSSSATSDCSPAIKSRASVGIPRKLPGSASKATPRKQCKSALPMRTLSSSSATSDASPVVKTRSVPLSYANKPATPSVGNRGRSSIATPSTETKRRAPSSAFTTRSKQRMSPGSLGGIDMMTDSVLVNSSVSSTEFLAYESQGGSTSSQNSSFGSCPRAKRSSFLRSSSVKGKMAGTSFSFSSKENLV